VGPLLNVTMRGVDDRSCELTTLSILTKAVLANRNRLDGDP